MSSYTHSNTFFHRLTHSFTHSKSIRSLNHYLIQSKITHVKPAQSKYTTQTHPQLMHTHSKHIHAVKTHQLKIQLKTKQPNQNP